jgi:ABC-type phosphate/phosphonate transport system permease subunit
LHEIRFGLLPQVLPVIAGQVLYYIESNTRSARPSSASSALAASAC